MKGNGDRHRPKPYCEPENEPDHEHYKEPYNPRYPDERIYGSYATEKPPKYIPHPYDHSVFRPRECDYKPPTSCNGDGQQEVCVRRDHRTLTSDQQTRFLNAFSQVNALNALGPLVDIHSNATHLMHSHPRFLPWHRIYLLRLEELLQMVDPSVCLPYWNSSDEQAFPAWLSGFTPTVSLASGSHTVNRSIGFSSSLPNAADVTTALSNTTYNTFRPALEGIHNSGHVWVGGSMSSILNAPCDPVFWMHHAEIDRRWAEWQAANPGENPNLAGAAAIMDPWPENEAATLDITALGYSYA